MVFIAHWLCFRTISLFLRCVQREQLRSFSLTLFKARPPLKPPWSFIRSAVRKMVDKANRCSGFGSYVAFMQKSHICLVRSKSMVLDPFSTKSLITRPPSDIEGGDETLARMEAEDGFMFQLWNFKPEDEHYRASDLCFALYLYVMLFSHLCLDNFGLCYVVFSPLFG
ncbi:hypothetical protein GQ457_07G001130 [Hibiscus cannabinus]